MKNLENSLFKITLDISFKKIINNEEENILRR